MVRMKLPSRAGLGQPSVETCLNHLCFNNFFLGSLSTRIRLKQILPKPASRISHAASNIHIFPKTVMHVSVGFARAGHAQYWNQSNPRCRVSNQTKRPLQMQHVEGPPRSSANCEWGGLGKKQPLTSWVFGVMRGLERVCFLPAVLNVLSSHIRTTFA